MASYSDPRESIQHTDDRNVTDIKKQPKITPTPNILPLDGDLEFSNSDFTEDDNSKINQKICDKLKKAGKPKFLERSAFPDDKVLVKLARRVYEETGTDEKLETDKKLDVGKELTNKKVLKGWQLLTTAFNKHKLNCYFGAAYWNPEQQQIVVAHRGTDRNLESIWTDILGVLENYYVSQMNSAITFADKIKVIVEELNKRDDIFLQLSFTGHSLGGWLAQVTTLTTKYFSTIERNNKLFFVKNKTLGYHAHTVVFDSPGCEKVLSKIISDFDLRYVKNRDSLVIDDLDITTYLSAPNLVNTCTKHIGSLYRVFIEDPPQYSCDLKNYTLIMHGIERIEKVFFSGKIKETQKVKDWPFAPIEIDKTTKQLPNLLIGWFEKVFTDREKIGENNKTSPTNEQKYFYPSAKKEKDCNPKLDDADGYCVIRYQLEKVDKTICSTAIFSQAELDFLKQYKKLQDNPEKKLKDVLNQFGDEANKMKDTFKNFDMDASNTAIRCKSEDILKTLIRYVKYIIHFTPEITDRIERILRDDPVWFRVDKLNEPFIGRTKELEQLLHTYILREKGIAIPVITGLEGVGKSELTLKYAREYYGKDNSIIWINAENEEALKISFIQLHKQLNLNSRYKDGEVNMKLIIDDVYTYLRANKESSIFIFDNAENYTAVEKFLPQGLNDCNKIHIVITSTNSLDWNSYYTKTKSLKLKEFHEEEAITFVKNSLKITNETQDKEINSLIQTLHKFPLALQQAIAYIQMMKEYRKDWNREYNIWDYLKEYEQDQKKILSASTRSEKADRNRGVFSTLHMTINKIKANEKFGEKALDMLDIISYFAPNYIPSEILLKKFKNINELILITKPLVKYSIVGLEKGMLNVHGLVQDIRKLQLEEENREEETLRRALLLLTEHIAVLEHSENETEAEKKEREKIKLCTPHVVSVWNYACNYMNLIEDFLIRGKKVRIPGTGKDLSVTYFNFIAAGSRYEIVKEIIDQIGEKEKFLEQRIKAGNTARRIAGNIVKDVINRRNNDRECALHGAAKNGKEKTVKLLVRKGANVNAKKKYGWTPLSLAVYYGHLSIVEHLLENKAKIGIQRTGREYTELHFASKNGNVEMVDLLLKEGADVNIPQKVYKPTVNYPIKKNDVNASQKVAEVNVSKKDADADKKTPKEVAYVNAKDQRLFTALHFAVEKNHFKIIELLLKDMRIDVNAETEWGLTPLHFAVKRGNLNSIKVLLDRKADVNVKKQPDNFTPLHLAVLYGNKEIITYLLDRKEIKINDQTTEGNTALHLVAKKGNLEVVEILIQKGADSTIKNSNGKLASDLADENGHSEVKSYIDKNIREFSNEPHDQVE